MARTPEAQEWIDDLIDPANQDKQGTKRLQSGAGKFCCLGRLCLIAERYGVEVRRTASGRIAGASLDGQPAVRTWARQHGIPVESTTVASGYGVVYAAFRNDAGESFATIGAALAAGPLA